MIIMDFPNAVTTRSAYYGRQAEIDVASRSLTGNAHVPVIVIGERRIGKTSLQNVVMETICSENADFMALQVEPRGITNVDQFAETILRQLTMRQKCDLRDTGLYDSQGHFTVETPSQFDLAFQRVLAGSSTNKYILCIDEFDEIIRQVIKTSEAEKWRLFALIHHLIERSVLPLSLFFTMTRVPDPMKEEVPSPLITKSQVIELLPFNEPECKGMINWLLVNTGITLHPQVTERMVRLSGGHPYFVKLLVSNLTGVNQRTDALPIDASEFSNIVLPRALEDSRANYAIENIYKAHFNPGEKSVLLYLSERREPVDVDEFRSAGREIIRALHNLEDRHYLIEQSGKYSTRIQFLEYWFRNWAEFEEELERLNVHHIADVGMNDPSLSDMR